MGLYLNSVSASTSEQFQDIICKTQYLNLGIKAKQWDWPLLWIKVEKQMCEAVQIIMK